jgi:hypothetical protein
MDMELAMLAEALFGISAHLLPLLGTWRSDLECWLSEFHGGWLL